MPKKSKKGFFEKMIQPFLTAAIPTVAIGIAGFLLNQNFELTKSSINDKLNSTEKTVSRQLDDAIKDRQEQEKRSKERVEGVNSRIDRIKKQLIQRQNDTVQTMEKSMKLQHENIVLEIKNIIQKEIGAKNHHSDSITYVTNQSTQLE